MAVGEYTWRAKIISGNRVTIPQFVIDEWNLEEGMKITVTVRRDVKGKGIII